MLEHRFACGSVMTGVIKGCFLFTAHTDYVRRMERPLAEHFFARGTDDLFYPKL